jgi:hypothetical protein
MLNHYGPSVVLGLLIGGAIIADDFIRPHPPHRGKGMPAFHALPALPDSDHKVWVMKGKPNGDTELHKEIRIVMEDERSDDEQERVMVMVKVADDSADGEGTGAALADAIKAVVDTARSEGREPTEEEIEAAVIAITGDSEQVGITIDVQADKPQ